MIRLRAEQELNGIIARASDEKSRQRQIDLVKTLQSVPAEKEGELLDNFREGLTPSEKVFLDACFVNPVFTPAAAVQTPDPAAVAPEKPKK